MACEVPKCASSGGVRWWIVGRGGVCGRVLFAPPLYVGAGAGLWGHAWGRVVRLRAHIGMRVYMRVPTPVRLCTPERPNLCTPTLADAPPCASGCVRVRARLRPYNILSPSRLFLSNFSGPPFDLEPKKETPHYIWRVIIC